MRILLYGLSIFVAFGSGVGYCEKFIPGELIIKCKSGIEVDDGVRIIKELGKGLNFEGIEQVFKDVVPIYKVCFPQGADIPAIAKRYMANPDIEYAHPNYILKAAVIPNDEYFGEQWALDKICASAAWDIERGTSAVIIAVPDTGVDLDHPDLAANLWKNDDPIDGIDNDNNGYIDDVMGWNFVNGNNSPQDDNGHGSGIAGVIAAMTNNGTGMAGVCWYCKVMPVKCLDNNGRGNVVDVSRAIEYAVVNGARVINMSFGSYEDIPLLKEAIDNAYQQGCVLVGATGNDNVGTLFYPAGYGSVTAVSAVDSEDRKSGFSNYGSWIDVSAPGENILTTLWDNSYGNVDGTSFATGFVSGLAGLIISQYPGWNNDKIQQKIINTADNIDRLNPGYEGLLGSGRINLYRGIAVPKIAVSPTSGSVGSMVTITGEGFGQTEITAIDFGKTLTISMTTTTGDGKLRTTFIVDTQPYGVKTVTATGVVSNKFAGGSFTLLPNIVLLTPSSGTVGRIITIAGNGYSANGQVRIALGTTLSLTVFMVGANGTFLTTFTINTQPSGPTTITVTDINTGYVCTKAFTVISGRPLPDLIVRSIEFHYLSDDPYSDTEPAPVELGSRVSIRAFITNQGSVQAKEVKVSFYDGDRYIKEKLGIGTLNPDKSKSILIPQWQIGLPPGTHTIRVIVDPENKIEEANENNNENCSDLMVVLNKGAIAGTVTDSVTNKPIAGAIVMAWGKGFEIARTDEYGKYVMGNMVSGTYTMTAFRFGYLPEFRITNVLAKNITYENFLLKRWRIQPINKNLLSDEVATSENGIKFGDIASLFITAWDNIEVTKNQRAPKPLSDVETRINFEPLMAAALAWNWSNINPEELDAMIDKTAEEGSRTTLVRLSPNLISGSLEQEHIVEVTVDKVEDLMGVYIKLMFDPEVVEVVGIDKGDLLAKNGSSIEFQSIINNQTGLVELAELSIGGEQIGVSGAGVIAKIRFKIKTAGVSSSITWIECDLRNKFNERLEGITQESHIHGLYLDLTQAYCYPNPTKKDEITFARLTERVKVRIFNIAGELVYGEREHEANTQKEWTWNCKNNAGEKVASGIYIYILQDPVSGSMKRGKMGIIR